MNEIVTCPDAARLRKLLDGQLSEEQQIQLNRHLESCAHCQQRLESLAAGTETWTAAARNLNAGYDTPEAGLERIMAESKREDPAELDAPPVEAALDFLSPSEDPAHLGRLGDYEILSIIRRGGMSVVLKSFDASLHRVVAIKVLAPQLAASAAARARFRREGYAAAAISHEHVVAVYGVDEVSGLPYLVMEYVSGESLQERLDRDGPLELKEILRIGMQTAQGLAAAHAQGLVHRDIKPANILLHNGVARVKITDFGLARAVDDATLTQSGLVAGTPQYMSPEQARGDAIDARTDLFSLGSVFYAMCAGRPPFRASTTMGVLKRVSDDNPRSVREVNAEVPPWFAAIIEKLHAKNPAKRFQSAAEVAELLGRHLAEVQQGSPACPAPAIAFPTSSLPVRGLVRPRKRRWAIAAALLAGIAGVFVASEATGVTNVTDFVATVLRIKTPEGTIVVETDDPGIEVAVDGGDVKIHGAGPKEIRVRAGDHRLRATKDGKEVPMDEPLVTVTRGGKTIVKVRQENAQVQARAAKSGHDKIDVQLPLPKRKAEEARRFKAAVAPAAVGEIAVLRGHKGIVRSLAFTKDGKGLISAGGGEEPATDAGGGELKRWDIAAAREVWSVESPSIIFAAALSPGGMEMMTAELDGTVRRRDADTGRVGNIFRGHKGPVFTVAFSPNFNPILSAGLDHTVKIWQVGTRAELLESFDSGDSKQVNCLAVSPDGKILAVGGEDGEARLFNVGSWKVRAVLSGHKGPIRQLAFTPDGERLATVGDDATVRVWNIDGKLLAALKAYKQTGKIRCLAFSPNGRWLATGGDDPLTFWNFFPRGSSGQFFSFVPGQSKIFSIAFSPDNRTLAFGKDDRTITLWRAFP